MFNLDNYLEDLANKIHISWSNWQLYFIPKGQNLSITPDKDKEKIFYFIAFEAEYIQALEIQAKTDYQDLIEHVKEYDRIEVRELKEILEKIYNDGFHAGYNYIPEKLQENLR